MLVGICGFIGSGKDTVADYLVDKHEFERVSFASTLKDACASVFHWDREMLEGKTKEARTEREKVDEWWADRLGIEDFSPRLALQLVGTDTLRGHFNDDIWILSLEKSLHVTQKNYVISDLRFPNEFKMVKRLGGTIVEVVRGEPPEWVSKAERANRGDLLEADNMRLRYSEVHFSEWARIGCTESDVVIDNNGTLDQLYSAVDFNIHDEHCIG